MNSTIDPKAIARRLRAHLSGHGTTLTQSESLELAAFGLGFRHWNTCAAATAFDPAPTTIPILRMFPGEEACRFYVNSHGFTVDWEHQFDEGMPLYQQVSREGCVLHLSEHHGDATLGSAVRVQITGVRQLQHQLQESTVYPLQIGLDSWDGDLTIPDPFGNRITFHTPTATGT